MITWFFGMVTKFRHLPKMPLAWISTFALLSHYLKEVKLVFSEFRNRGSTITVYSITM